MKTPAAWWSVLGALSAALLGLDYLTGPRILFPVTFVLPVSLAAWHLGRWPGISVAVVLTLTQFTLMPVWSDPHGSVGYGAINAAIRLAVFVGLAVMVAHLAAQARELARRVLVLEGILPVCSYCKRIRRPDGKWEQMEAYISQRSAAEFSHGICGACGRAHFGGMFDENAGSGPASGNA